MIFRLFLMYLILLNTAYSIEGHGVSGAVTISGALKKLLNSDLFVVGSVTPSFGVEVLDFNSKALYCSGGVSFSLNPKVMGIGIGGSFAKVSTFDNCSVPDDYKGGFLKISASYSKTYNSKSFGYDFGLNLGFDFNHFNKTMISKFSDGKKFNANRVKALYGHQKYIMDKISLSKTSKGLLKFMFYPIASFVKFQNLSILKEEEALLLKDLLKGSKNINLKKIWADIRKNVLISKQTYNCEEGISKSDCQKTVSDLIFYLDLIEHSLLDCHSFTANLNVETDISLSLFKNINFAVSIGYYDYYLEKTFESDKSLNKLANYYYSSKLKELSKTCHESMDRSIEEISLYLWMINQ